MTAMMRMDLTSGDTDIVKRVLNKAKMHTPQGMRDDTVKKRQERETGGTDGLSSGSLSSLTWRRLVLLEVGHAGDCREGRESRACLLCGWLGSQHRLVPRNMLGSPLGTWG